MKLVFVLVDALKSSYVTPDNMPFLYDFCTKGTYYSSVIPSPGFCERSEIFTGLDCFQSGNCTAIGYMPEQSAYRNEKFSLFVARILELVIPKATRYAFDKYFRIRKKRMKSYLIPYSVLDKFALTEDGNTPLIDCRDIFDSLRESGLTYSLDGFTSLASSGQIGLSAVSDFVKEGIDKALDFLPVYLGEADSSGHEFGADIEGMSNTLRRIDDLLSVLFDLAKGNGYAFAVLGDHGMVPVEVRVDVNKIVKQLGLKLGKDYLMFLDSTIVRFWFFNSVARQKIISCCKERLSQYGQLIDADNYETYNIPLDILNQQGMPVYGDLMWCANPGVLITPDYFNPPSKLVKGMHGYLITDPDDGVGMLAFSSQEIRKEKTIALSDVCDKLCKLLGIAAPNDKTDWRRVIK